MLSAGVAKAGSDKSPYPPSHDIGLVEHKVVDEPVVQRRITEALPRLHGVLPEEIDADVDCDQAVDLYSEPSVP